MSRLERSQLLLGLQGLMVHTEFDTESSRFGGGDGGNAGDFVPAGGVHYVHSVLKRFKAGVSAGSYFGLGLDYGSSWAGRYYVTKGSFFTLGVNPGISYRLTDWFSIGAGFSILCAELDQEASINNSITDPGTADGKLKIKEDDVGYGFNLGVLFDPTEQIRVGLTYRSQAVLNSHRTEGLLRRPARPLQVGRAPSPRRLAPFPVRAGANGWRIRLDETSAANCRHAAGSMCRAGVHFARARKHASR